MRFFREHPANVFTEATADLTVGDTRIPLGNLQSWNADQLAAVNVYAVADPVAPQGQVVASFTVQRVAGVVQAVPVYAPAPAPQLTFLEFMALFTDAEQTAIIDSSVTAVKLFLAQATGAQYIDLGDPRLLSGLQGLTALGILTSERAGRILSNQAPA